MEYSSSEMAQGARARLLADTPRYGTASEVNHDTSEFMGFRTPDAVPSTTNSWAPTSHSRDSLSIELYPADSVPHVSPSGRLAQMNLNGGSAISPGLCPLEEEDVYSKHGGTIFPAFLQSLVINWLTDRRGYRYIW